MAKKKKATKKKAAKKATKKSQKKSVFELISEKYGKNSIVRLGSSATAYEGKTISTGSMTLDKATGVGGIPRGRIIEVFGKESSGKSTLCQHLMAEAQAMGLKAALIDAEHALDPQYAADIGIDMDELYVNQPNNAEEALGIVDLLAGSGEFGIVVVDSVAALTPKAELDGEIEDQHVALQARLMSKFMRRVTAKTARSNTLLVFINQMRAKIGVKFGAKTTTTGGNALKYFASMRIELYRKGMVKHGDTVVAMTTVAKMVKNKCAAPFTEAEFDIRFGVGIDKISELLDAAEDSQVMYRKGSRYQYNGSEYANGRENVLDRLRNEPDTVEEVRKLIAGSDE